jgi:hypothetical protein
MKKQKLLLASTIFSVASFAQSEPHFGVRAGIVSSGMKGDAINSVQNFIDYTNGAITTSNQLGFFAGVNANIPVSELVSIEPGLFYTQKGYQLKGELGLKGLDFLGVNAQAKLSSHYVDLPVLLKLNFNGLQIFAGPQISYLAKADLRTTAGALGFNVLDKTMDATGQFNRWDAAITGGVGYQFGNGFTVSGSYDHGLSKLDANKSFDSYNRGFKLGIGYQF